MYMITTSIIVAPSAPCVTFLPVMYTTLTPELIISKHAELLSIQ